MKSKYIPKSEQQMRAEISESTKTVIAVRDLLRTYATVRENDSRMFHAIADILHTVAENLNRV